jgi:hypothetical protein
MPYTMIMQLSVLGLQAFAKNVLESLVAICYFVQKLFLT